MTVAHVVSPHLDDAVLSCGQLIAGWDGVAVVHTVFAGCPDDTERLTAYDRQSGFVNTAEAVHERNIEDRQAAAVLGNQRRDYDWLDVQYGDRPEQDAGDIQRMIAGLLRTADDVFVPLGLAHPDHTLVGHCARLAGHQVARPFYVYEELPYRVLDPDGAVDARRALDVEWHVLPAELPAGDIRKKETAVGFYRSQTWNLNVHSCLVPERFWKLVPR